MPQVYGWSDDDFDDRSNDLAALIRRVWRAIARLIAAQAESKTTVTMEVAQRIPLEWQQSLDGQIIGFVRDVYLDAAGAISDAVNAPDELLVGDDLVEVYTNAARNRLVGIGDEVWQNVQAQITLGNQLGEGIPEIAARIRNVAGVSEARSLVIARTEVHAAFESGAYEQAMFVDPDATKVWLATEDERTRPSHRHADGQKVKIGGTFQIGKAKLRFPGDPLGEPGETINCRCSVAYDFDMITTVVDEPEPAMTASGGQAWKPHLHPRGNDGKFIEKGAISDFLKKAKPNVIDVQKAVLDLNADKWKKLTPEQKDHIEASVDKLPKGTQTHTSTKAALDSVKANAGDGGTSKKNGFKKTYATTDDVDEMSTKDAVVAVTYDIKPEDSGKLTQYEQDKLKSLVQKAVDDKESGALWAQKKFASWTAPGATPPAKYKPKLNELMKDAKHGDVIASGTKYNSAGQPQKFRIIADKSHVASYMPNGKMRLEYLKKDGSVGKTLSSVDGYTIHSSLTPLPAKGKKPAKVDWDDPNVAATPESVDAPSAPNVDAPAVPAATPTAAPKLPAGLKGNPGDVAKITTGVIWGKHPAGTVIVEHDGGLERIVFDGKKFQHQTKSPFGGWTDYKSYTKNDAYKTLKGDSHWLVPGKKNDTKHSGDVTSTLGHDLTPEATPEPPQTPSAPEPTATAVPDWTQPQDFSGFSKIGGQAGSNPGGKYKAPDGTDWYVKKPKSAKHAANEQAAAAFYNLAGINAPQVMKGKGAPELGGDLQTGTKIVPGAKANLSSKLNDKDYVKEIQSGFAMDAWLANWDVAGMGYDNIVEGGDGKPHRIDVGGAMLYRAQGEPKAGKFGDSVDELQTLRDGTNPQAAKIFGSMTDEDIRKSTAKLEAISDEQIDKIIADAGLPAGVAQTLKNRRANILAKYPPLKETDAPAAPTAESAKAKMDKLWDKGLITEQEYFDAVGDYPGGGYNGVHDKGVLLNDLESGYILPVDQAIDLAMMLDKSDYDDLSDNEKTQLQTTLSTAADMDFLGGKDAYAAWQKLHKTNSPDTTPRTPDSLTDEPDVSKIATSAMGALTYLDEGDQPKMISSDGKYVLEKINSPMGKYSLETKGENGGSSTFAFINNSDDVDYVTGEIASLWYPAKPKVDADASSAPSGPMISGNTLGLKPLHNLIVDGKHGKKYSDGQVVAVSPDGTRQLVWRDVYDGYAVQNNETGNEDFIANIHAIKMIRSDDWHVPENLLMDDHGGEKVATPNAPDAGTAKPGVSNAGAMGTLALGEADVMMTPDGKWELYKSADGKWTALKENHPNGTATVNLIDTASEINHYAGAQTWHPKHEVEQSINAPDSTTGVSNKPVDLSVIQENIDLGEYTSGETIGITQDGQQKLVYSAFLNGVQVKTKIGDTGDDDMDWDTEASYSDDTGSPVADFLDDYPGIKLFEEQPAGLDRTDAAGNVPHWPTLLADVEDHGFNDVVAETTDGKFKLVKKSWGAGGPYAMYEKNANGKYQKTGQQDDASGLDLLLPDDIGADSNWITTVPGHPIPTTQLQALAKKTAKKAPAKKVAGVPQTYSAAAVTPGEKKFYLDDAADGALVPSEAVHLLNGEGGLTLDDVKELNGPQVANINAQLGKALDNNVPGSAAAWQKWAEFENQLNAGNGYDASQIADHSYIIDMEDEMWAGEKSTGDVIAITPDGKQRLVVNSTEGPGMNPDSFALETHGPFGWETTELYKVGTGSSLNNQFWNTQGHKAWLVPDGNGDDNTSTPSVPSDTFDPPGTGESLPGTLFDMLSWVPEGKPLLVGKNSKSKYLMTAEKSAAGTKAIKVSYWDENDKTFKPSGFFDDETSFKWWADQSSDPVKWDVPGKMADKSALEKHFPDHNKFSDAAGPEPDMVEDGAPKPMPALTGDNIDAVWDHIQTLDVGTPIGTAKNAGGQDIRAVVWANELGEKKLQIQKKNADGNWENSHVVQKQGFGWDLEDYKWSPVTGDDAKPAAPPAATPDLTPANIDAVWDHIQGMNIGDVLTTNAAGDKRLKVVPGGAGVDAWKYLSVETKDPNTGDWKYTSSAITKQKVQDLLGTSEWGSWPTDEFGNEIDPALVPPSTPAFMPVDLDKSHEQQLWDAVQSLPKGTVVATGTGLGGENVRIVVNETPGGKKYATVEQESVFNPGQWNLLWHNQTADSLGDDLNTPASGKTFVSTVDLNAPSAPTAPSVTPATTAPAPPLTKYKIDDLKFHLKQSGNLGYYSKPENIWAAVKEWQAKPNNAQYSPMDLFKALDGTLKTSKPNPFQEKMKKWAASKKGAQIIGADGIFGPSPTAAPAAPKVPALTPGNHDAVWAHIQTMKAGDILAVNEKGDKRLKVITDGPNNKTFMYESKNSITGAWSYYAGGNKMSLKNLLEKEKNPGAWNYEGWKPAAPTASVPSTPSAPAAAKKTKPLPDIEAGGDISGISEAKQEEVYKKFKGEPFTYLKSPEHSIFDAIETVAKSENLTLAQVLHIVDEVGAKKFGVANTGPFKTKIAAWLKTPEAAAHINNDPSVVKGLPTPPAFNPKYDPYLNPGQIPTFEESSKYEYKPLTSAGANALWNDVTAKTEPISSSQTSALKVWISGVYQTINGFLYKPNQTPLSPTHKKAMEGSQQGMRPSTKPVLLVRGTGFEGLGNAKNHNQLEKLVGTTWRNNAFAATSIKDTSPSAYGASDPNNAGAPAFASFPLWIEFECPPGTPMAWLQPFSGLPHEREMLLPSNLHYKILSVEKKMIPGHGMKSIARVRIVPKPEGAADE